MRSQTRLVYSLIVLMTTPLRASVPRDIERARAKLKTIQKLSQP